MFKRRPFENTSVLYSSKYTSLSIFTLSCLDIRGRAGNVTGFKVIAEGLAGRSALRVLLESFEYLKDRCNKRVNIREEYVG